MISKYGTIVAEPTAQHVTHTTTKIEEFKKASTTMLDDTNFILPGIDIPFLENKVNDFLQGIESYGDMNIPND